MKEGFIVKNLTKLNKQVDNTIALFAMNAAYCLCSYCACSSSGYNSATLQNVVFNNDYWNK